MYATLFMNEVIVMVAERRPFLFVRTAVQRLIFTRVPNRAKRFARIHTYKGNFQGVAVAAAKGPQCGFHCTHMVQTRITVPNCFERQE